MEYLIAAKEIAILLWPLLTEFLKFLANKEKRQAIILLKSAKTPEEKLNAARALSNILSR